MKKRAKSFEDDCKDFTIQALQEAIEKLESIGAAADDAGLEHVTGRIYSSIDDLREALTEAQK